LATLKQVQRSVKVFHGAATVLLDKGYPGQAVARAHYAVLALCEHIAEQFKDTGLWPKEQDGSPASRYFHAHVPRTVRLIFQARQGRGTTVTPILSPDQAYAEANRLLIGRMDGDYSAHLDVSKEVAAQRIIASHTLCQALNAEAEFIAAKAAKQAQQQAPAQVADAKGGEAS
jgi:hypothetical protein